MGLLFIYLWALGDCLGCLHGRTGSIVYYSLRDPTIKF